MRRKLQQYKTLVVSVDGRDTLKN